MLTSSLRATRSTAVDCSFSIPLFVVGEVPEAIKTADALIGDPAQFNQALLERHKKLFVACADVQLGDMRQHFMPDLTQRWNAADAITNKSLQADVVEYKALTADYASIIKSLHQHMNTADTLTPKRFTLYFSAKSMAALSGKFASFNDLKSYLQLLDVCHSYIVEKGRALTFAVQAQGAAPMFKLF